jgi:hypothetical protein
MIAPSLGLFPPTHANGEGPSNPGKFQKIAENTMMQ